MKVITRFKKTGRKDALVASGILTILAVTGGFIAAGSTGFNGFNIPAFLLGCVVLVPIFYVLLSHLFDYGDREKISEISDREPYKLYLKIFIVIGMLWLPFIILMIPGNIITDTVFGLMTDMGLSDNVDNPLYTTLLYNTVLKLAMRSGHFDLIVTLYCIVHALACLAVLSYSVYRCAVRNADKYVIIVMVLFYGLMPCFPVYAFGMAKDSIFALLLLILTQAVLEWAYDRDVAEDSKLISAMLIICAFFIPGTRNGTWALAALIFGLMLIGSVRRGGRKGILIICICISLVSGLALPAVNRNLFGHNERVAEGLGIPLQQMAYIYTNVEKPEEILTEEEYADLSEFIRIENFYYYNPIIVDQVKEGVSKEATKADMPMFWHTYFKTVSRHPAAAVKAFILGTSAYYVPWISTDAKDRLLLGISGALENCYTDYTHDNTAHTDMIKSYDEALLHLPILGLFDRIGIYMWMLIIIMVYLISKKDLKMALAAMAPLIFLIGCCFSPVNGYYRYAVPVIVCTPVLFINVFFCERSE